MIFAAPEYIKIPQFKDFLKDGFDNKGYMEAEQQYTKELEEYCLENNSGKYVGKVARFGVADGYAMYMVASLRPLEMIHLPLGDAYNFPYVDRLKAKDFKENIDRQERLAEIFGHNK